MINEYWIQTAEQQCGLITTNQFLQQGVTRSQIRSLERIGVIRRADRGLYSLAGAPAGWPMPLWRVMLLASPSALALRRSAAAWWGMDGMPADSPGGIEVAVPRGHQSRVASVKRMYTLESDDVVVHRNLRVTTPARTLIDLGDVVAPSVTERALEWCLRHQAVQLPDLGRRAKRLRTPGSRQLAALLTLRSDGAPATESDAETLFVQLARREGYPDPQRQRPVLLRGHRYRLDFAWPSLRLAVEIDGGSVHGPGALARDLFRQNQVLLDGWLILRFTWGQLVREQPAVEADLRSGWVLRGGIPPA